MTSLEPAMTNHAQVGIEVALGIHERIPVERADIINIIYIVIPWYMPHRKR